MVGNKNILAITQVRIGSTRFPAKILQKIQGKSLLEIHLGRIKQAKHITKIIVATTHEKEVSQILDIANNLEVGVYKNCCKQALKFIKLLY